MARELEFYDPQQQLTLRRTKNLITNLQSVLDSFHLRGAGDWITTGLELGSLKLASAPVDARQVAVPAEVVNGLRHLAEAAEVPTGWPMHRVRALQRLVSASDVTARISELVDGKPVNSVTLDDNLRTGIARAIRGTHRSFGSLIGHLKDLSDTATPTALLVLSDRTEVQVEFKDEQDADVRAAWRQHAVQLTGYITERADGTPIRLVLRTLEVLPEFDRFTAGDAEGGFYPDIAGHLTVEDYVASMRGTA